MKYLTTSKEMWKHLKPYVKENRHNLTMPEKIVWSFLKKGSLGVKFRRQQAIAFLFLINVLSTSCSSNSNDLEKLNLKYKDSTLFNIISKSFFDSTLIWSIQKVEYTAQYSQDSCKILNIFANSTSNRFIFAVLIINSDSSYPFDDIQFVLCEKKDSQYSYFLSGMPAITITREGYSAQSKKKNYYPKNSFDKLYKSSLQIFIEGGLIINNKINDDYINRWFKPSYLEMHQKFLNYKIKDKKSNAPK